MTKHSFTFAFLLAGVAAGLTGCGSSGPPTGKVIGKVAFKQQPVDFGLVTFHSSETGQAQTAKIESGKFEFETPLEVGSYAVFVSPPVPEPRDPSLGPPPPMPPSVIPPKAQDPMTSGLSVSVAEGSNDVVLELQE